MVFNVHKNHEAQLLGTVKEKSCTAHFYSDYGTECPLARSSWIPFPLTRSAPAMAPKEQLHCMRVSDNIELPTLICAAS